jgi:hypothetical protein
MPRAITVCALVLAVPLATQAGGPAMVDESLVRLKVQAARAPRPALRYQLLPELSEMEPGNAVLGYLKCFAEQGTFFSSAEEEKRGKWLEMPFKDLPLKEVRAAANRIRPQIDYAARLNHADWQALLPLREQGYRLPIPEVQQIRSLAVVLLVRFRADVAERNFDDALFTAKTLLALARHMGEHPTLIGDLIGIAFINLTGCLLAVEADLIVQRFARQREKSGGLIIVLGFSDPLPYRPFHRGLYPWSRFPCGTNLPARDAISSWSACGR